MKISNIKVLIALVFLTLGSYFFSKHLGEGGVEVLLLLFTIFKVFLIALYFMEMKKAHFAWVGILGFVMVVYLVFIYLLNVS